MSEDGPGGHGGGSNGVAAHAPDGAAHEGEKIPPPKAMDSRKSTWAVSPFDVHVEGMATPLGAHSRRTSGIDLDEYFVGLSATGKKTPANIIQVGPKDLDQHSKLPYAMRLHGSVLPRMILPILFIGVWATTITVICKYVVDRTFIFGFHFMMLTSSSWRQHSPSHSPGFRSWSCPLLPQYHCIRTIRRWSKIMDTPLRTRSQSRTLYLGTHR